VDRDTLLSVTPDIARDLETEYGSVIVISPQGGFETPLPWRRHGSPLIQTGDLLYIRDGDNRGIYVINNRLSDTELQLYLGDDSRIGGRRQNQLVTGTGQAFQILRRVTHTLLPRGVLGTFYAGQTYVDIVGGNDPFSMGVTTDDVLVCTDGPNIGVYRVLELEEVSANDWSRIHVEPLDFPGVSWTPANDIETIFVIREVLLANPIRRWVSPTFTIATSKVNVGTGPTGLQTIPIRLEDELWQELSVGPPSVVGKRFTVKGIDYATGDITVSPPPTAADVADQPDMYLVRPEHRWASDWWDHKSNLRFAPVTGRSGDIRSYASDSAFSKVLRDLPQDEVEWALKQDTGKSVTLTLNSGAADIVELVGLSALSGAGTVDDLGIKPGDLVDVLSGSQQNLSPLVVIALVTGTGKLQVDDNTLANEAGLDFQIRRVSR